MHTFWSETIRAVDCLGDLGLDGTYIKMYLTQIHCQGRDCIELTEMGLCEHGNEHWIP
jgi:hypothetical protein